MTQRKNPLGDLAKKIDDQDDPREVYVKKIDEKKRRLDDGGVPEEKRPI